MAKAGGGRKLKDAEEARWPLGEKPLCPCDSSSLSESTSSSCSSSVQRQCKDAVGDVENDCDRWNVVTIAGVDCGYGMVGETFPWLR